MKIQKLFLLLIFSLSPFLFPLAFALPFQEPVAGSYQCFIAGEDPFNVNTQDAGAILELNSETYTLITASATEQGSVLFEEFPNEGMEDIFQSGSNINLQPSSGGEVYGGMFLADWQGGMYVIIKNNNDLWIRCETLGADIAAAFENAGVTLADSDEEVATEETSDEPEAVSEPSNPEDELLPVTTTAPPPPAGAGGLTGLYIDWTLRQTSASVMGSDGMPFYQVDTLPPEYMYFLPNGYVYRGIYDWSYEDLDCKRVKKNGTPLCDTYVINGNSIAFGNGDTFSFAKDGNDLVIDDVPWYFELPVPEGFTLDGSFENTSGYGGISVGSSFYTFHPDGTFESDSFGAVIYSTPETASSAPGIESTQTSISGYSEGPSGTGTYSIRGNTIEFTYANGSKVKYLFNYSTTDAGQVDSIWLDGAVYWQ